MGLNQLRRIFEAKRAFHRRQPSKEERAEPVEILPGNNNGKSHLILLSDEAARRVGKYLITRTSEMGNKKPIVSAEGKKMGGNNMVEP
jgi:hypothetical protein